MTLYPPFSLPPFSTLSVEISTHFFILLCDARYVEKKTDGHYKGIPLEIQHYKFVPEADFEMKYFQSELAQRPVNRFQRPWKFFLTKIIPQIDSAHSKTMNMHPRALRALYIFFCKVWQIQKVGSDLDRIVSQKERYLWNARAQMVNF